MLKPERTREKDKSIIAGCLFTDNAYTFTSLEHFMWWTGNHTNKTQESFFDKDFAKGIDVVIATLESRLIADKEMVYMNYNRINTIGENLMKKGYSTTHFKTGVDGVIELVYIFNRNFKPAN
jgi:hypothetical protein